MVQKTNYRVRSFDGGLNEKTNPNLLEDNEFQEFTNIGFSDFGLGRQRLGENTFGRRLGPNRIDGLGIFRPTGQPHEVIIIENGNVWKANESGQIDDTALETGLSVGYTSFVELNDLLFIAPPTGRMRKWDGSEVTLAGVKVPGSEPNVATTGSGNLNGNYKYVVTFETSTTESNPSPETVEVSPSGEKVELTDIPTSSHNDAQRRIIYRTQDSGETFLKLAEIDDNTTTSYVDNITDSELGTIVEYDKGVPPESCNITEKYHNTFFCAGDPDNVSRLYFSGLLEPENWDDTGFIDIQSGRATPITAMVATQDQLLVFKENGMSSVTGTGPSTFSVTDPFKNVGCPGPKAVTVSGGIAYFYDGGKAVYRVSGSDVDKISFKIEPGLADIDDPSDVALAVSQENELHVSWENPSGQQREYIYHIEKEAWTRSEGRSCNLYANRLSDSLLAGSRIEGQVFEMNKGASGHSVQHHDIHSGTHIDVDKSFVGRRFRNDSEGTPGELYLSLRQGDNPARVLQAEIWNDQNGEPGERVARSENEIAETSLDANFSWKKFEFNDSFSLDDQKTYHAMLVASETVNIRTSIDLSGKVVLTDYDYIEDVDLEAGNPETIVHDLGTEHIMVQFYDENDQKQNLESVYTGDDTTAIVESGVDISGKILVADISTTISYQADMSLTAGQSEIVEHDIFSEDVLMQFYSDDGELIDIDSKIISDRKIEVESAVDVAGKLVVIKAADSEIVNTSAGLVEAVGHFTGQKYVLVQFYEDVSSGWERADIDYEGVVDSNNVNGTEWEAESDVNPSWEYSKSADGNTWTSNDDPVASMRLYTFDIPFVIKTPELDFSKPEHRKQARRFTMDYRIVAGNFKVDFFANEVKKYSERIFPDVGGAIWNQFYWDQDEWASDGAEITEESVAPKVIGRKISFRIKSVTAKEFGLTSLHSLIHLRARR